MAMMANLVTIVWQLQTLTIAMCRCDCVFSAGHSEARKVRAAESECGLLEPCDTCRRYRSPYSEATSSCAQLWSGRPQNQLTPTPGLDEPFGLAIGSWGVRLAVFQYQAQYYEGLSLEACAVGATAIGQHPLAREALAVEPGHSPQQEDHGDSFLSGTISPKPAVWGR